MHLAFFLAALCSCSGDADDPKNELETRVACKGAAATAMTIEVTAGDGEQPSDHDVTIRGTARHDSRITIRQIVVQGVIATNDGFNYSTWSAVLPIATLLSMADAGGKVQVGVHATDACNQVSDGTADLRLVKPPEAPAAE